MEDDILIILINTFEPKWEIALYVSDKFYSA